MAGGFDDAVDGFGGSVGGAVGGEAGQDRRLPGTQGPAEPGWFAPGHLGELTQIVPFEMVDDTLASTGSMQARVRDPPSRVVVYLLLAAPCSRSWDTGRYGRG
jgi:hypothetical protein